MLFSNEQRFRDILLLSLGFIGVVWFFTDFQKHWVPSTISINMADEEIVNIADSIFKSWDYAPINKPLNVYLANKEVGMDSLQRKYGSTVLINKINEQRLQKSRQLPYYINVVTPYFEGDRSEEAVRFELSENGELVNFSISSEEINAQTPFNRELLLDAFQNNASQSLGPETEDSLIAGVLDFQHNRENAVEFQNMRALLLRITDGKRFTFRGYMNTDIIWKNAQFYIDQSYWKDFEFKQDTLIIDDKEDFKLARVFLTSKDSVFGIYPKLEIELLPGGSLRKMKASYFEMPKVVKSDLGEELHELVVQISILIFGIWLLIIFYLRIKARAIDTSPALVVAVLAGFLVPALLALKMLNSISISIDGSITNQVFGLGVLGALSSVGFFLLTAVSDSITRQYWPEKLKTWDLVRQGIIKNKPVGWAILRGLAIGGVMVGVFLMILKLTPNAYLQSRVEFVSREYLYGALANQLVSLAISVLVVVPTFLILVNQVYGMWQKKWAIPILSGLITMLLNIIVIDVSPIEISLFISFILGFILGLFYLKFDFVTLALAYYMFLNIISAVTGWAISGSPDLNAFYVFIGTTVSLLGFGIYFIIKGNDKNELPDYIPVYLEKLAEEQRFEQELDIARLVQHAFLPNITPEISGFDTAVFCDPAMEAGGDYYDIIRIDEYKASVAIGDVSGKGIRAAFYMTFIKGVIHSLSNILLSPKKLLTQANRLFNNNATRGTFITMIYGVLDSQNNTFTYVRAGHNPLMHKKANGEIKWLQPKGLALGMAGEDIFSKECEEVTLQLEKGDVLVLYTDGVTEAQNRNGEFYGEERLYQTLKNEKSKMSSELLNLIVNDVRAFYGETTQYDDMTLVVIKV
ncbi:MAG: PP2C family protein-serine/threonine phosphatase [Balneolaceae bacterium]